ncbi:MAG: hypothetical protein GY701_29280 [Sulfitobacter sp.]|nr:hypothetical protein [Sulfitobacter sp.]
MEKKTASTSGQMGRRTLLRDAALGAFAAGSSMTIGAQTALAAEGPAAAARYESRAGELIAAAIDGSRVYALVSNESGLGDIVLLDANEGTHSLPGTKVLRDIGIGIGGAALIHDGDGFRLATTERLVVGTFVVDHELPKEILSTLDEGVPRADTPTSGEETIEIASLGVRLQSINNDGAVSDEGIISAEGRQLEPIGIVGSPEDRYLVANSSGQYGLESNLLDEVGLVKLERDGAIGRFRSVLADLGHSVSRVDVVPAGEDESPWLSVVDSDGGQTVYSADTEGDDSIDVRQLEPLRNHDRRTASGTSSQWLAEVVPGVVVVEGLGG